MQSLQIAYEARAKKINKVEETKALKSPMQVLDRLEYYAQNGYDAIPQEDKDYFLKCFGIYDKDALTPKRFMMRVRIAGGYIDADAARVLGGVAKEYGNDYMDITTRAQAELRYLDIKDIPSLLSKLKSVGIDSYQTGVDNFRNIVTDPFDSYAFDNILPSYEALKRLQEQFLHKEEWISALPRKFNTSITGSISNRCNAFGHDCCFVLAQKDGSYGYNIYLGGKVGKVAKNADIFVTPSQVETAYASIIDIFKRFGFRDNRNKNRLAFLIESVGMEELGKAIRENAGVEFLDAGDTLTKVEFNESNQGKVLLRDGSFAVHIVAPSGIFSGSDLLAVSDAAQKFGSGEIRFDVEQSVYILGVKDVGALLREDIFKKYKSVDSVYKNNLIACAGTQHCSFGVIENKSDAVKMAEYLEQKAPLNDGKIRMYWSGCVKGCGLHGLADIGFEGCKVKVGDALEGGVNISLGGKMTSDALEGYTIIKSAPLRYAHLYVETMALEYKRLKNKGESFESFGDRILKSYSRYAIGFMMKLGAYLRVKNIEIEIGFSQSVNTGKNEEFELFETARKIYYKLSNKEPYTAYERFTNRLKNEKLQNIRELVKGVDENLAILCDRALDPKEQNRAVVFSEVMGLIELY